MAILHFSYTPPPASARSSYGSACNAIADSGRANSEVVEVLVYVAPIHDHHAELLPRMQRKVHAGDDAGSGTAPVVSFEAAFEVPDDAVGSFLLVPLDAEAKAHIATLRQADEQGGTQVDSRARWFELLRHRVTVGDPGVSAGPEGVVFPPATEQESGRFCLPEAPCRPGWESLENSRPAASPELAGWQRAHIAGREVWLAGPAEVEHLLIVFDAARWICTGLPTALERLAGAGRLPNFKIIAVDTAADRVTVLGLSPSTARWVAQDLLQEFPGCQPERVIVAGQSLGGLMAAEVVRRYPARIGRAVCLSPSFWWPDFRGCVGGQMLRSLTEEPTPTSMLHDVGGGDGTDGVGDAGSAERFGVTAMAEQGVRLYSSAGYGEGGGNRRVTMVEHSQAVAEALRKAGVWVREEYSTAAHEMVAWEGAMTRGVLAVMEPGWAL